MRKIIYWVHVSLDGFIEGPNGEFDWASLGPELGAYSEKLTERADTLVYGRVVWDMMSSWWPTADADSTHPHDITYAPYWRATPKIVFSRTLTEADWDTRIISGDLATEVQTLKSQPGADLLLTGGSTLAGALTELGLIDEYHLAYHPVSLGGGKPVFAPAERIRMKLVESQVCDGSVVVNHYQLLD